MTTTIEDIGFRGPYSFLSNFYVAPYSIGPYDDIQTVEHGYQASKTYDRSLQEWILASETPKEAKRRGRGIELRSNWELVKYHVMLAHVRAKFKHNKPLAELLVTTPPHELVEWNNWHDNYWGHCRCEICKSLARRPQNKLGLILQRVRRELL